MRKRWKNWNWVTGKEPPLFWQAEFLQKVALALFLLVAAAAVSRLITAFARAGGF
jgi:hypothetical protein